MNEYEKVKYGYSITAFSEITADEFFSNKKKELIENLNSLDKLEILNGDDNSIIEDLADQFTFQPLRVFIEEIEVEQLRIPNTLEGLRRSLQSGQKEKIYSFKLLIPFTGNADIFKIKPNSYVLFKEQGISLNREKNKVEIRFDMYSPDVDLFEKQKKELTNRAFSNLENANNDVQKWNKELKSLITLKFLELKEHYRKETNFFKTIKLKANTSTSEIFTTNNIKKVKIPRVKTMSPKSLEPTLSNEIYDDILNILYTSGKNMEKKPSLYQGKDEEEIRDLFVFLLETRYESTTATRETFNKTGKTDIILKYEDGTNLFVAECKFWKGESEFQKGISQLFDRYLTWRDSKAALLIFVRNANMTAVVNSIRKDVVKHPYFIRESGRRGETSFSFIFHLPEDQEKNVLFEIMAFHYSM